MYLLSIRLGRKWANRSRRNASVGVFDQQTCPQRRPGHPAQHGLTLILLAYLILITILFYYLFPNSMSL